MSIDLLPFSAFALESCAAPAVACGEGRTLTLPLRRAGAPMAGELSLVASDAASGDMRCAGIARAQDAPLTITF